MPQFLYRLRPARIEMLTGEPTESEMQAVAQHFAYLQRLLAENILLMAGRTLNSDAHTFGIVVFTAPSEEQAAAIMQADPGVREGVMQAELFPYQVALWSKNFTIQQT